MRGVARYAPPANQRFIKEKPTMPTQADLWKSPLSASERVNLANAKVRLEAEIKWLNQLDKDALADHVVSEWKSTLSRACQMMDDVHTQKDVLRLYAFGIDSITSDKDHRGRTDAGVLIRNTLDDFAKSFDYTKWRYPEYPATSSAPARQRRP
jgi:hypothetical protein